MPAVAQRDLGRRRRSGAGGPDDDRLRQIRNSVPVGVGPPDVFVGLSPPYLQPILMVRQIKLAVDDSPSLGIDRILVRCVVARRAHGAVAVVLRRLARRSLREPIAVLAGGQGPEYVLPPT